MGIEGIISRIRQEAHEQANSGIAGAKEKARGLRREFEKELERKKNALQREMEEKIQAKVDILISEARRKARDNILRVKESIIQACIESALSSLMELPKKEYREVLMGLVEKGKEQVGERCLVSVTRPEDGELLTGAPGVELISEVASGSGGVVVYSLDKKLRVNNTFEGILQRKRSEIRDLAARRLFP